MTTIETDITVTPDGKALVELRLPSTIPPGKHRAVVMVDEGEAAIARPLIELPLHDFGPWPADLSLRREDLYGDHGRYIFVDTNVLVYAAVSQAPFHAAARA